MKKKDSTKLKNEAGLTEARVTVASDLETENDLILTELHRTQEELNGALFKLEKSQRLAEELDKRVNRFVIKHPESFEFDELQPTIRSGSSTQTHSIEWNATNAYIGGIKHRKLKFLTSYNSGITGITFLREGCSDLTFFNHSEYASELICLPVSGPYTATNNATLSNLGSSDWKTLLTLISKLNNFLEVSFDHSITSEIVGTTIKGLNQLQEILNTWPEVLRYDSIALTNTIDGTVYQALDIEMQNVTLGSNYFQNYAYRLSSVNELDTAFGQHPRLEFFDSSKLCFEEWFAESDDERGRRLELRFAQPNQMDINVWNKLSDQDKYLVAATISKLPDKLKTLRLSYENVPHWDNWIIVAEMLKKILSNNVK